jgi:pimeloyl-ACP methyl ester carboxylesterase
LNGFEPALEIIGAADGQHPDFFAALLFAHRGPMCLNRNPISARPRRVPVPEQPLVVLVHGAIEQSAGFSTVLERLPEFDVVAYDRRGHGSRWREGPATLDGDIDDLIGLLSERAATVVGHSLGGLVTLGAALRRPELFEGIGLYETAIPWAEWWSNRERHAILEEIERNSAAALEATSDERAQAEVAWTSCRQEVLEALQAPFRWGDLAVPITTGCGAESESRSARDARRVAAFFGGEAVVLSGAGHRAHRTNPDAFADFVRQSQLAGRFPAGA